MARHDHRFDDAKDYLSSNRQQRCRNGALQNQLSIVECQTRYDRIAQAAGTDERRERCRADTDNGSGANAGQNGLFEPEGVKTHVDRLSDSQAKVSERA